MTTFRFARRALGVTAPEESHGAVISFGSGDAYPEGLPDMGDLAQAAASKFRTETMQYSPRLGLEEMREWIADAAARDGVTIGPEHVIVVNGAKNAIDLVCRVFLEAGDTVVVTAPTYKSALNIFRGYRVDYVEVGLTDEGLDVDELEARLAERARAGRPMPKFVYDVPEFHNPTGITLTAGRRRALLALADRYDLVIVEDDPYRRIRFQGEPVPPIKAFDVEGRAITIGTFAKLVAPGLRLGWVVATPEIVARISAFKADGGSCPFTQRLILEYAKAGRLEAHVREVTEIYRGQRDVMMNALERYVPDVRWRVPFGGYYLWLRLPEHMAGEALARAALARGVSILPGSDFFATSGPRNHVRLAYSHASPSEITEGVRRLGEAFREIA